MRPYTRKLYNFYTSSYLGIGNIKKCLTSYATTKRTEYALNSERNRQNLWEDLLPTIIKSNQRHTAEDWKCVREKVLRTDQNVSSVSVDSTILNYCISIKDYSLARQYLEFLKSENYKLNLATLGKYFRVFYLSHVDQVIKDEEEEDIFKMYTDIRNTYSVLDYSTCENVILGLSITKHWKTCLQLLDEIKISCPPTGLVYSTIVSAAFRNSDYTLGWNLLEEMIENSRAPSDDPYLSYIKNFKKSNSKEEFIKHLQTLFDFFKLNNVECSSEVALHLGKSCRTYKMDVENTSVTDRGLCLACKQKMPRHVLNEEEFKTLKDAIFDRVIVGKNVFFKTTPTELDNFKDFLTNMQKYDVVIDGLNVAYSTGKQSGHILSKLVLSVVRHFHNERKRILVLGRTHMNKWPNWKEVTNQADTFLTQSLSHDDPYLLYCALASGLNTIIVSRDLMRSHLFKLQDPHLKTMFTYWLNQCQVQVRHISHGGRVFFNYPLPFLKTAQTKNNHWHVPYTEAGSTKWLCIRR